MKIILFFVRRILSLRYSVILKGANHLKHDGPVLILPNHVALVDPRIMISFL
jgi:1-acyl-sn-glycerol-3-phosphate acyltransferase